MWYLNSCLKHFRSQQLPFKKIILLSALLSYSGLSLAAQNAQVYAEKAVIYADEKMTSAIGFVRRGKMIRIGDIPRNKAQVYPLIVSGKRAYIRSIDISILGKNKNTDDIKIERFTETVDPRKKSNISLSYLSYATQISMDKKNDILTDKSKLDLSGLSLFGQTAINDYFDLDILFNFLEGAAGNESFKMFEVGAGASFRILDFKNMHLKAYSHLMLVPFANYELGTLFRVNSYGFGLGAGGRFNYYFTESLGAEVAAGLHYTSLGEFDVPSPYHKIKPSFVGTRLNLGLSYRF